MWIDYDLQFDHEPMESDPRWPNPEAISPSAKRLPETHRHFSAPVK